MKYRPYSLHTLRHIEQINRLTAKEVFEIETLSRVLPFKTNNYVVDELIDWEHYRTDPMYLLNFPQRGMLEDEHFDRIAALMERSAGKEEFHNAVNEVRYELNPHPAGQMEHNIPELDGERLPGIQHKYRETVLFFPSQGQTCHAFCTFCFRWPQFTGMHDLKFGMKETERLIEYIRRDERITDVLITGGDPMVMSARLLSGYINALLEAGIPHLRNIRIGSKTLAFWPYRYLTDPDADEILQLFRKVTDSGIHLAFMAHFSHPAELGTTAVQEAIGKIRATGAQIRTQSPVLRHINNSSDVWAAMWKKQVELGMIPYYMFIARDTGARGFFSVSLSETWRIFRNAYKQVSGIARTVRGPSMSANPGKVQIVGVMEVETEPVFVLVFLQARNPDWVRRPFLARYDPKACWLTDLKPAFGEDEFFYSAEFRRMLKMEEDSMHMFQSELDGMFNCSLDQVEGKN